MWRGNLTIGIGAVKAFGIFQKPIAEDLQVGREVWSFANALAGLVVGLLSPFVGSIADRLEQPEQSPLAAPFTCLGWS